MKRNGLHLKLQAWRVEGEKLAGSLTQLAQRASVYRHIYRASGGNHIFPLIAAHGALWARGYFRWALDLGQKLAWQYAFQPELKASQLASLDSFANAFRDINRRVCADTYANFHFTAEHGEEAAATDLVPLDLLQSLNKVHAAQRTGRVLTDAEKQEIFTAHFLYEQEHVVGPSLQAAVDAFDWPAAKFIALRPVIHFAYFPERTSYWFRNFADRSERISRGQQAFQLAAAAGFPRVEAALRKYEMLPEAFFAQPSEYFASLRQQVLGVA
ncbi:hypothetical protein ETAA8_09920 [Anatilimnocola aggregata]|uniref:Uncharacterized protein n=1 Tax=Anatilimnocola aggregata TaxID=2528021 RepID=A0A517Y6S5_9BACT|nr:hypothetical protein [Anatilimnocola aggregata]QDU25920.1 hypothetical protein ETAA8_09920 [Anatilimnocola aggregata]